MDDTYELQSLEQLKSVSNKVRIQIISLHADAKPRTIEEMSQELGLPPFKVQLHLQELLRTGIFYEVDHEQRGVVSNTYYLPVARTFYMGKEFAAGLAKHQEAQLQMCKVLFDRFVRDYRKALKEAERLQKAGQVDLQTNPDTNVGWLFMTPEQRTEFSFELLEKMEEWEKKYSKQNSQEGATPSQLFCSVVPTAETGDE